MEWGSISSWVTALIASIASICAVWQLRKNAVAQHDQVQIARANLLREIDRDFESSDMIAARQKLLVIRNRYEAEVEKIRLRTC